jgi:2-polyprenyl-6-methoxyphenol hydroxylase-like FAD-dependent oxidoreductase
MARGDLYRALNDLATARGVSIALGKRLVGVDEGPDGVTARFDDGTTATGDVLIGADGIRSRVRSIIDAAAPAPSYVGFLGFGGFSSCTLENPEPDAMCFVFGKRAFLGYWSPPEGGTAWFANLPRPESMSFAEAREIPSREWLRVLLEAYGDDVPARALLERTAMHELLAFGGSEILPRVPTWHRGRMVLVGDAAHAPSSSSGQGASLAIESAVELARCLRDVPDPSRAFAAYEQRRRARVEKVAAFGAKQNGDKVAGPIAKALMSLIMPIAMRTFLRPEKRFGWMHRHRIDWDETVNGERATQGDGRPRPPAPATA